MARFLAKVTAFGAVQTVIFAALISFGPAPSETGHYLAAPSVKRDRLLHLGSPKVVLVGGSNLAFGIDSELLSAATGAPVVNLGVDAGIPIETQLAQVERAAAACDLVILCPEYHLSYAGNWAGSPDRLVEVLAYDPTYATDVPAAFWADLIADDLRGRRNLGHLAHITRTRLKAMTLPAPAEGAYCLAAFNGSGDVTVRPPLAAPVDYRIEVSSRYLREDLPRIVAVFRDFAGRCRARLLYAHPPVASSCFHAGPLKQVDVAMRSGIGVPVINEPYSVPDAMCYDSAYHLTLEGRKLRTDRLIRDLRAAGILTVQCGRPRL